MPDVLWQVLCITLMAAIITANYLYEKGADDGRDR